MSCYGLLTLRHMHHQWLQAPNKRFSNEISEHSDPALPQVRKWIEECCGLIQDGTTFQEYLQDGTVLCKLIETIQPGLIKRVNYAKSPFAWRENCVFFLEACKKLGLKGAQLCKPEDLIGSNSATSESQKHFRNVAVTLYWLGKSVKSFSWYTGPVIQSATDEVNFEAQPQTCKGFNIKEEVTLQCPSGSLLCSEAADNKPLCSAITAPKVLCSEPATLKTLCETTAPKTLHSESPKQLCSKFASPKTLRFESPSPKTLCTETAAQETLCSETVSQKTLSSESVSPKALWSDLASPKVLCSEPGLLTTQCSETSTPKEKHQHKTTVLIKVKKGQNQNLNTADQKSTASTGVFVDSPFLEKELCSPEVEGSVDNPYRKLTTPSPSSVPVTDDKYITILETSKTSDLTSQPSGHFNLPDNCSESSTLSLSGDILLGDLLCTTNTVNSELAIGDPVAQISLPKHCYKQSSLDSFISLTSDEMQNINNTDQNSTSGLDLFLSNVNSKSMMIHEGQEYATNSISMDIEIFLAPSDKHLGITLVPRGSGMHSQVESIAPGSPASCSLLKVGDEIVSVNSVPVFADEETTERIKKAAAEGKVLIGIKRLQPVLTIPSVKLNLENKNISTKQQALDLSRVRSDALPQGMLPKMVHCASKTQSNASLNISDHLSVPSNVASEVKSIDGSEKLSEINLSNLSVFGSTDSYLGNMDAVNGPMIARADTPLLDGIMEIVRKNSSLNAVVDHSSSEMHSTASPDFSKCCEVKPEGDNQQSNAVCAPDDHDPSMESVHDIGDDGVLLLPQHHSIPLKHGNEFRDSVSPQARSSSASPMHNRGIEDLITSLRKLNETVGTHDEEDEFKLLEEMLKSSNFKKAKEFHDMMLEIVSDKSLPVLKRIIPVLQAVRCHLLYSADQSDALINELRALLRNAHVQAVLFCHDKVSTKDFYIPGAHFPRSAQDPVDIVHSNSDCNIMNLAVQNVDAPLPRDVPSGRKENAVIIFVLRMNKPLGISVYKLENTVYIGQLLDGDRIENLVEGDELLEINGISLVHKTTTDIMKLLACQPGESLALTIIPVHDDTAEVTSDAKYVRAHFNYEAALDDELPCKPLGLSFQRGDILEISNQDDPNWWQACRIFEDGGESLPGLIPARHLMQKREALRIKHHYSSAAEGKKGLMSVFAKRKKKKFFYQQGSKNDYLAIGDEVVTYEDVIKFSPDPGRKRPIVLVGAPGVGKKTLIQQLLKLEPGHFSECIQHTTRPIQADEIHGTDYYFVSKEDMDREGHQDSLLEYIEQGGFIYGVAYNTVKRIMESNYIPILKLHPQTLKKIRNSGLMPYIIFICSPSLERLQVSRKTTPEHSKRLTSPSGTEELHSFSISKLQNLVEISCTIEQQYGHYFDWTIVNDNLQVATDMLREVTKRVEEAVQWVPANWIQDC